MPTAPAGIAPALCGLFLLSGAAALAFETLWFRQAGLVFGNGVWSSSLVLAAFMGGLALGNLLAGRHGAAIRRPVVAYALLEAAVAISGAALVLAFPHFTSLLAPLFRPLLAHDELLNVVRLALAFGLMLVPAAAMGATLPILTVALTQGAGYGPALGRLYGWNTLGAVVGAVAAETVLIGSLGIRGTGLFAAGLNLTAAALALAVDRRMPGAAAPAMPAEAASHPNERRILIAGGLCGALLLALEVVWFRFLLLFVHGSSLAFALMLAVVLLGIGAGGIGAAAWLRRSPQAHHSLSALALAAGGVVALSYASFPTVVARAGGIRFYGDPRDVVMLAVPLMLPVALISGILFTLLGAALHVHGAAPARTTSRLTVSNTIGAMLGALAGGFVLLPLAGMEAAFAILALAYGAVALLLLGIAAPLLRAEQYARIAGATLFTVAIGFFPFGLMRHHYLPAVSAQWRREGSQIAAVREGRTETIVYLRRTLWGEPVYHRLLTNGISMSGSHFSGLRYMKLFVYLPVAFHPEAKRALLISYGVGATAQALTDTRSLESIDVVDISREILQTSREIWPPGEKHPLDDRRVRIHVEDGRFFLLTSRETYDLITAEPPPPKMAGVVNLYSREYFDLVRARLAPQGVATHWLPVMQMEAEEARAIIKAFCGAFPDCTLWTGFGAEWLLAGGRGPGAVGEARFTAQWNDPVVGAEMRRLGLESPDQLGTLFLGDAPALAALTESTAPVVDDRPNRLSHRLPEEMGRVVDPFYSTLADVETARRRFAESPWVRSVWPPALRERTLSAFIRDRPLQEFAWSAQGGPRVGLPQLHAVLTGSALETPVAWLMWSSVRELEIARRAEARGRSSADLDVLLAIEAMAHRRYADAEARLARARQASPTPEMIAQWRVLALDLAGRSAQARAVLAQEPRRAPEHAADWGWLDRRFAASAPAPAR